MGLAEGQAARCAGAHARRVIGIDRINVKGDMNAGGAAAGVSDRLGDDRAHALQVDLAHGIGVDARGAHRCLFQQVEIADADEHRIFRRHLGAGKAEAGETGMAQAEDRREGHAVDVSRGGSLVGVHVGVGVKPDQADLFPFRPVMLAQAGHRAQGDGMIAAQHHRNPPARAGACHRAAHPLTQLGHLAQKFHMRIAGVFRLEGGAVEIAGIVHREAERLDLFIQAGDAQRRRAHVHTAAGGAEVGGDADDFNGTGG